MFLDGPDGVRLFARYHAPPAPPRAAFAFVHPLFEEKKAAHRILLDAAGAFAAAGVAVLRVDLRGCGDSSGRFEEAGVSGWQADIDLAVDELGRLAPGVPIGLLGLRFGATLAGLAAERSPGVRLLALWEPVADPRGSLAQDLRRRLVREMLTRGKAHGARGDLMAQASAEHPLDFDGYPVTPALLEELGAIDWPGRPAAFAGDVLVLGISSSGAPGQAVAEVGRAFGAARVESATVKAMPFWNLVGLAACPDAVRLSADWVRRVLSAGA